MTEMDTKRWQQIDNLLGEALDRKPEQRKAFLAQACAGDEELRREIESLMVHERAAGSFMESPALDVAAWALAGKAELGKSMDFVGQTILHYKVMEKIGEGGMGTVYKALDTHLQRPVAIKVLPPEIVLDRERRARFVQEARAASALNHPNIVTIHDIDQVGGTDFIAMEYVEGKTLGELIPRKGMRLKDTLKYSMQIADALAAAHAAGIVHRDLKPANVMVTEKGLVKVLDFGLAKLTESAEGDEPGTTETLEPRTEEGTILGTVAYMSPEQAEGKQVDARSDIFSLGSVLYEMVTGQQAFQGTSKISTLSAILHEHPKPVSGIAPTIPADLEKLINRCLRKDPAKRFQHMDDMKVALEELKEDSDSGRFQVTSARAKRFPPVRLVGAVLAVVVLIATGWYWMSRQHLARPEAPLTPVPLTSYTGSERGASFSPDGNQVAFAWNGEKEDNWDIYVKLIGSGQHLRLTTNPARDTWPAWSRDGRQIAFCRDLGTSKRAVVLISPLAGPERILTELENHADWVDDLFGPFLSWSPDGRALAMYDHGRLNLYMVETGEKYPLTKSGKPDSCPAFSPDGRTLAFRRWVAWANSDLYLLDLSQDLKPVGEPRRLTFQNLFASGVAWGAVSDGGVAWVPDGRALVYSAGGYLWRVASSGTSQPQKLASLDREDGSPAISARGSRLAYAHTAFDSDIGRIEISSPDGRVNPLTQFISSTRFEGFPRYSRDGRKIAFVSERSGSLEIWVCDADGSNAIQLTHFGGGQTADERWSPDGSHLTFDSNTEGHPEVYVVNASGGNPQRLTFSPYSENPSWSKDGRWIYFDAAAGPEHSIQKVPAEGGPVVLVLRHAPGFAPVESADGKAIFVTDPNMGLWRVPIEGGESRQVLESLANFDAYEVTDDGIYFIPGPGPTKRYSIRFLKLATGEIRTIAELGKLACGDLAISPDRRWALYSQTDQSGSDLMLVENFR
jgi:serine/threonine protein kinase/dipeptidyl aminopeptidase/acylaminoacyl peptidase